MLYIRSMPHETKTHHKAQTPTHTRSNPPALSAVRRCSIYMPTAFANASALSALYAGMTEM